MTRQHIRQPIANGRFYPGTASELSIACQSLLQTESDAQCLKEVADKPSIMLVVPHAGYVFSGLIAGSTLNYAKLHPRCIALGPNHTGKGKALAVWDKGSWITPLGSANIDSMLASSIIALGAGFEADEEAHLKEHSIEVLLPLWQHKTGAQQSFVPVCVGTHDLNVLRHAGQALGRFMLQEQAQGKEAISLLVSTDMSHYLPHHETTRLDSLALEQLCALNPEALFNTVKALGISMCGVAPVTLAMFAALEIGATHACKVAYANSGQTGAAFGASMNSVVGYAGIIIS